MGRRVVFGTMLKTMHPLTLAEIMGFNPVRS